VGATALSDQLPAETPEVSLESSDQREISSRSPFLRLLALAAPIKGWIAPLGSDRPGDRPQRHWR